MPSLFKKVQIASIDELKSYIRKYPQTKYIDAVLCDISGIIRGKRMPAKDAKKLFISGVQFCYSTFLYDFNSLYHIDILFVTYCDIFMW